MQIIEQFKTWNPALRVRRNHALEHATLQILTEKKHPHTLAGLSDTRGFWYLVKLTLNPCSRRQKEARQWSTTGNTVRPFIRIAAPIMPPPGS